MEIKRMNDKQEEEFMNLTQELYQEMEEKDRYCPFNDEFISILNPENHFMVGAYENGELMGGFSIYFPMEEDSYSNYLDTKVPIDTVAQMDNCAVAKKYRGRNLQEKLCKSCEQILLEEYPERVNLFCTVHPDNPASLKNMETCGFQVVKEVENMYHGNPRYILRKNL